MGAPTSRGPTRPRRRVEAYTEVPNGLVSPGLPSSWESSEGFKTVVCRPWSWRSSHINVKETRVALMSVRHVARVSRWHCHRLVVLSDSMVALGCLEKGRSSCSRELNGECRRLAAYSIGCCLGARFRYVSKRQRQIRGRAVSEVPGRQAAAGRCGAPRRRAPRVSRSRRRLGRRW